jgi:hypothetical protein
MFPRYDDMSVADDIAAQTPVSALQRSGFKPNHSPDVGSAQRLRRRPDFSTAALGESLSVLLSVEIVPRPTAGSTTCW